MEAPDGAGQRSLLLRGLPRESWFEPPNLVVTKSLGELLVAPEALGHDRLMRPGAGGWFLPESRPADWTLALPAYLPRGYGLCGPLELACRRLGGRSRV